MRDLTRARSILNSQIDKSSAFIGSFLSLYGDEIYSPSAFGLIHISWLICLSRAQSYLAAFYVYPRVLESLADDTPLIAIH